MTVPLTDAALGGLTNQVLGLAFLASFAFGAIANKTNFCTMGAVSDALLMGDYNRAKQWLLAACIACMGFGLLVAFAGLDPNKTLYASSKLLWVSAALGGLMFGFGMVLASGCGSKTLVRLGGGNLKSLVVFVVMGLAAFATLKGITAVLRVATVDAVAIDLGALNSLYLATESRFGSKILSFSGLGCAVGLLGLGYCLKDADFRKTDNLLAGLGIGILVAVAWWISGVYGFVPEHPQTLEAAYLATASGRAEAMSFVAPIAHSLDWLMFFSDKSKVLTVGVVSVLGVVLGSAAVAVATRSFRWEGFRNAQDTGLHLVGAVLMGVGGVTAMGCTVGQGLSGISTLSFMSMLAVAAVVAGAVGGLKCQMWLLERDA